jgi:hypothetical protein
MSGRPMKLPLRAGIPYGNGYWMWTPRFGYIWVSGYSWGYMPYQCGDYLEAMVGLGLVV